MLPRRTLLAASLSLLSLRQAHAQAYPAKPIRLVVPYAPGGGTDIAARLVAQRLSQTLKQPVVVDNRAGAGGNIGAQFVAAAPKDGYSLLFAANSIVINAALYASPGYDIIRDFTPVAGVASTPVVLVVRRDMPAETLGDFITYARGRPGHLNHGTPGPGTPQHLAAELFGALARTQLVHVPYRGTAPSVAALLSGEVDLMFASSSAVEALVREERIRPLAVTSAERVAAWPGLPAIAEALPGYDATLWYGILAPKASPPAAIATVEAALESILRDSDFARTMRARGFEPGFIPAQQLGGVLSQELARWRELGAQTGIRIE